MLSKIWFNDFYFLQMLFVIQVIKSKGDKAAEAWSMFRGEEKRIQSFLVEELKKKNT